MAIISSVPGIEVAVTVDGSDVKEYTDPDLAEEPNVVTKYIEVSSECEFGLRFLVLRGTHFKKKAMSFNVYVDDTIDDDGSATELGRPISDTEDQKFRFATLKTTNANDHSPVHEREQVKKLGTIEIIVEHRQQFGLKKPSSFAQQDLGILSEVLSEKSLKGQSLSQSVSYGETVSSGGRYYQKKTYGPPIARFVFKYRSPDALKALMIIKRTPSPSTLEEMPLDELTLDQMRQLLGRQRARDGAAAGVKRERSEEGSPNDTPEQKRTRRSTSTAYLEIDDNGDFVETPPPPSKRTNEAAEIVQVDD
ncbi:hypothetical protein EV356DRAFT_579371 [Viridothelium virens]|uniref:DUF7918 domain-containing protein n=1 Tax=Viridothelium virens TaxID=1048519 RepID=A0A6A6H116_VIRVR|nr:hypothetical protein EV356DRAFT_579371 [Viridothelium virens]